jgi:TRAP-type C4-dicarboxylate transport system substrate-binding protein
VDGSENTPSNMLTQKHHEVQKIVAVTDHGYIGYAVIANKKFWDGLPADVRSVGILLNINTTSVDPQNRNRRTITVQTRAAVRNY